MAVDRGRNSADRRPAAEEGERHSEDFEET